jgi:hypothetical protein
LERGDAQENPGLAQRLASFVSRLETAGCASAPQYGDFMEARVLRVAASLATDTLTLGRSDMKKQLKKLLGAAGVSFAALSIGTPVSAAEFTCAPNTGLSDCYGGVISGDPQSSFTDWNIGDIALGAASDLIGFFATAGLNLSSVSLTSGGNTLTADKTTEGFSFDDVASGTYQVSLSGMLTNGFSLFGTQYGLYYGGFKQIPGGTVPQIPEPETYALLLAGLLTIGFVARRRSQG